MPLIEIGEDGLIPYRRLRPGADLFEKTIENLLWNDLDTLIGEDLFRVRRQAQIAGGGRPDIVALDKGGSVVVIEVKRDVDRSQLAQCLEYAGWARTTSLDEIAGLYHGGTAAFWSDWQEFTDTAEPSRITRSPRLMLVARDFDSRTDAALDFLRESGFPVGVVRVALYEDPTGRQFLDVEGSEETDAHYEPRLPSAVRTSTRVVHQVTITDLIGADFLDVGEELVWERPKRKQRLTATITGDGRLRLPDGRIFASPSGAAVAAVGHGSFDGWHAWRAPKRENKLLNQLRRMYQDWVASATDP